LFCQRALTIARDIDIMAWRRLVGSSRQGILLGLAAWWQKFGNVQPVDQGLVEQSMEGVEQFASLIAVALDPHRIYKLYRTTTLINPRRVYCCSHPYMQP
jgi:hypothetical protein